MVTSPSRTCLRAEPMTSVGARGALSLLPPGSCGHSLTPKGISETWHVLSPLASKDGTDLHRDPPNDTMGQGKASGSDCSEAVSTHGVRRLPLRECRSSWGGRRARWEDRR